MSIRTILKLCRDDVESGTSVNVRVCRDTEWNQYIVRIEGKPEADYFTDDKYDAIVTAEKMTRGETRDYL